MDTLPAPALRNSATPRLVPLDDIGIPDHGLRRAATSAEQDAGMLDSVRRLGVLQPIILRPDPLALGRYILVAGRRRYRAALAAGLGAIPAEVHDALDDADAAAIEAAENLQRAAMAPTDQWRAIVRLQELGWDLDGAAEALGIPARTTRRLAKLGAVHPDILAAIEKHGMPQDNHLRAIASATPEAQARALKACKGVVNFWDLADKLRDARIPRSRAIFDTATAGVAFEEDLFAEPGSDWQFVTTDAAGFLKAQRAALEAQVAASKGKLVIAKLQYGRPEIPTRWEDVLGWKLGQKLPRGCTGYVAVDDTGVVCCLAATPPAAKKPDQVAPGATEDDDEDSTPGTMRPVEVNKPRFTEAGRILIDQLKTDALRATLRDRPAPAPTQLLALLLLALAGDNVTIRGEKTGQHGTKTDFDDIAAAVWAARDDADRIQRLAAEALARILRCGPINRAYNNEHSGDAAEWIGEILQAHQALPRLDREDLLASASLDALQQAAHRAELPAKGTGKALRQAIAGQAEHVILFDEALFKAKRSPTLDLPEVAVSPADCGQNAGAEACRRCGWARADGEDAEACELAEYRARLARLGLTLADVEIDEDGFGRVRAVEAPPPDHDTQRRQDAAAFDAAEPAKAATGALAGDCGWSGDSVCREEGTTLCEQLCPRHARYAEWLATTPGKAARRAADNQAARASLKRAKKKGA